MKRRETKLGALMNLTHDEFVSHSRAEVEHIVLTEIESSCSAAQVIGVLTEENAAIVAVALLRDPVIGTFLHYLGLKTAELTMREAASSETHLNRI